MDTRYNMQNVANWIAQQPGYTTEEKISYIVLLAYEQYKCDLARAAYFQAYISKTTTEKVNYLELAISCYKEIGFDQLVAKLEKELSYITNYNLTFRDVV